jgi:D-inositol-3-phosphate glycosyltransferase
MYGDPVKGIESIRPFRIAMLSIHSSPLGPLGTRNTGGMSVYVRELAQWLGWMGHAVDIFTCMEADGPDERQLHPNVRLIRLTPGAGVDISKERLHLHLATIFEALDVYCRKQRLAYDLIHSHYWLSGIVGDMARRQWRCPHLITFHTLGRVKNNTASGENEPDLRIAHECRLVQAADAIVAPAVRERENLIHLYNARERKIKVIPCGVNLELFQPRDRAACRRRLGIAADRQVGLFVGRFAALKGLDALLGAIADLAPRIPGLRLVVAGGDGPVSSDGRAFRRLAESLHIQDRVWFAGRIEQGELPVYYNAADLLVVPSHYESFGLVVLEALACGTPVAATRVGAVDTIIRPGINGTIMDDPGRDSVAQGIARLLENPVGRDMDPATIRDTVAHCGWQQMAAAMVRVYGELIASQGDRPPVPTTVGRYTIAN